VLATIHGADVILCQITSQSPPGDDSVVLNAVDFAEGGLNQISTIRPSRLFTADEGIIVYRAGHINALKLSEVLDRVLAIFHHA
jgi:mRNA interferase MazF